MGGRVARAAGKRKHIVQPEGSQEGIVRILPLRWPSYTVICAGYRRGDHLSFLCRVHRRARACCRWALIYALKYDRPRGLHGIQHSARHACSPGLRCRKIRRRWTRLPAGLYRCLRFSYSHRVPVDLLWHNFRMVGRSGANRAHGRADPADPDHVAPTHGADAAHQSVDGGAGNPETHHCDFVPRVLLMRFLPVALRPCQHLWHRRVWDTACRDCSIHARGHCVLRHDLPLQDAEEDVVRLEQPHMGRALALPLALRHGRRHGLPRVVELRDPRHCRQRIRRDCNGRPNRPGQLRILHVCSSRRNCDRCERARRECARSREAGGCEARGAARDVALVRELARDGAAVEPLQRHLGQLLPSGGRLDDPRGLVHARAHALPHLQRGLRRALRHPPRLRQADHRVLGQPCRVLSCRDPDRLVSQLQARPGRAGAVVGHGPRHLHPLLLALQLRPAARLGSVG
mmetsp:Transcript_47766/g.112739  ORF Transcript_47766/g.112739 Transcript_47766/m.112739 type:complete len:459 (-) Transcript_47766:1232-2608(-)